MPTAHPSLPLYTRRMTIGWGRESVRAQPDQTLGLGLRGKGHQDDEADVIAMNLEQAHSKIRLTRGP